MLLQFGVDVEDKQIALGMNLPYLFDLSGGEYIAGPMLQTSDLFNLYLNTLGYAMTERTVSKRDVSKFLPKHKTAMLGLRMSPNGKHAVVFIGTQEGKYVFLNNKREDGDEEEKLYLSVAELEDRLDDTVMIATISKAPVSTPSFTAFFDRSCQVLEQYKIDIQNFCSALRTNEEIVGAMDPLFRATLLDGITMLELICEEKLAERFRNIQRGFLSIVREGRPAVLNESLDIDEWLAAVDKYISLIKSKIVLF